MGLEGGGGQKAAGWQRAEGSGVSRGIRCVPLAMVRTYLTIIHADNNGDREHDLEGDTRWGKI